MHPLELGWWKILHPLEVLVLSRNLKEEGRRCLGGSHLGRSLPTQRPRLEEEYGRRSRGLSKRYN